MRSRNREVNIFNMSLLDILTGMMGAFLFLMLGMVPYYTKVKAEQQNPSQQSGTGGSQQGPQIDALIQATIHWNSNAKANLYLYESSSKVWDGSNTKNPLFPHGTKISDGSSSSGDGWDTTGDYVQPNMRYIVVVAVPSVAIPQAVDPASYSGLRLTTQLTVLSSKANQGGVASFSPRFVSNVLDTTEFKPGHIYAVCSLKIDRDETKQEYYQQYRYEWDKIDPAADKLPPGIVPMQHPWQ